MEDCSKDHSVGKQLLYSHISNLATFEFMIIILIFIALLVNIEKFDEIVLTVRQKYAEAGVMYILFTIYLNAHS